MRATAFARNTSASSFSKQLHRVLLLSALFVTASVNSLAQITVSPASLTFAAQLIDTTSAAKSVTITNNGASAQPIVIALSGDYTETDNCSGSVAGGGSCTAKITFAPTILGSIKGAATIDDNSNNLLAFVGITGTGQAPVTTAPASLAFTGGTIGTTSAAKTFKITNNTTSSVNITSITTTNAPDYTITTGTCLSTPLASKGKYCTVTVTVTPTSAVDDGAIIITDNAPNALPLAVKLTSAATAGTSPISLSKTSLTFKTLSGTTSAAQTITVTNTSASAVTIGTITASTDYAILNNTCPSSLAAAAKCTFQITFSPTFIGAIEGSAAIPVNSPNIDSPQIVNLAGTSLANLTVAPASLTFAAQGVGTTSAAKAVKITNNTASTVTLSNVAITGDFGIQASGTTCLTGGTLLAAKTCTIEVQFSPTIAGAIAGAITVTNTSSPNPLIIDLTGTGTITYSAVLNPASAHQGTSETILITGTNTNFGPTTTVNFGANITTGTVTVNGPTSASVPITIAASAATGSRSVTITTGTQVVTTSFSVIAGVPAVTLINPNNIGPTQTEPVTVTGVFTNWVSGTTKANFGPGIAVGGAAAGTFGPVTVNSATSLTASLVTSGAALGFRTVQIQTGSQTLTVANGMDVETCGSTAPTILHISPANGASGMPLNTQVQVQFSVPMNRSTLSQLGNTSPATVFFWDSTTGKEIPGTISVDASGTIATITPSVLLAAGRTFYTYWSYASYVQDVCGNNLGGAEYYFYTDFSTSTTGPTLTGTSPVNGDTNIPLNGASSATPVVLQFDKQIDPITAQTGFSMQTGGNAVPGNFSYSTDDKTVTFTPVSPLTASTSYTVSYGALITDTVGNPLTNPGSFSFTAGTGAVTTGPTVTLVDPPNGTFGVGLNATPHLTFSEPVDGLTIPGAAILYYEASIPIPITTTVSADRLTATVTPSAPLLPSTYYYLYLCGYTDIAGNGGSCFSSIFYTGSSADTNPTTVSTINPSNLQTGVPVNARITAVMSDDIDPTTVTNSSITVTPSGGSAIAGTVTLASDGVTLTFVPTSLLTVSKVYNVSVGGFKDIEGNAVTTFTSSFTTGTTGYGSGSFTLVSTSPVNGATGVSVTSPVTFTMTNLINPASVNTLTVEVYVYATSQIVAGNFSVSGAAVTFTPLTQYPANTQMGMYIYGLTDEAGNAAYNSAGTFTTANTVDHTAPTVTISPANGATNVGLNTQIVLTFSKSINPSTITANTLALFNGDAAVNYGYTISRDNRTIVVNPGGSAWTSGATITIELTNGIQDMSGNALVNTNSQFTLTTALSGTAPYVLAMRPGNGATNVPANTVVTLFTSLAMNPATITGALHVTDNGVLVSGTVQLFSNAQAIEFTPGNTFNPGDLIQVYLDSSALSASNVALSSFSGQFTVAGSPTNTAATVQAVNPFQSATNVPLNTNPIQVEYNQALTASTINHTNVTMYQYATSSYLTPTLSLVGTQVINIAPTSNLLSGSQYQVCVSNVTNTNGIAAQNYCLYFYAGTAADTAAPTIVSQAPTDTSTNIGTNTAVSVNFNKAMNPVSVTGSTIKLSAGATTEVPSSISFSPDYTRVSIVPQAPLPPSTVMTVAISGVTSQAGKSVAAKTTHFTTAAQPDFTPPYVTSSSVLNGQTSVPVNSAFVMQFSKPMDIGSYNAADVNVYGYYGANYGVVPATVSWSADQTTIFIVPNSPLNVGDNYYLESYSMTDLSGNPEVNFLAYFSTAFVANTNAPTVINTSPENTETLVPVNAPVQILFSEPIQPTSISQITLTTGGNPVAVTATFSDANQLLTLTPTLPLLAASANYTLTITGVKDTAGNTMTGTVTNTFTTGPTFDLLHPSVTLSDPAPNTTGVGTNVAPRIVFNKRLNPLSVVSSSNELYNRGSVELYNNATNQYVPATVSMSADRLTATITPTSALLPNTYYTLYVSYGAYYYDVAGNYGNGYNSIFVTGSGSDTTAATVSTISPANTQTGVPINTQVVAVMSDDIDPTTVTNSSITVTPSGGSAIAGTVTLASDGVTLTFVPSAPLAVSKLHNVSVSGFKDTEGNPVTTFTSSFTTGTTSYGSGSFTLVSTSPVNGATGVSVTSPVTFTMNNLINAASVNPSTVEVYVYATSEVVAGSYSVSGAAVTFTPLTQYPASTQMGMYIYGLTDEAGNAAYNSAGTFTTTTTVDHTAPTVTITPTNNTANAGLNTQVVLTFSKSINPATITPSSVNLLNGDVPINPSTSISRDNRTVVLNYNSGTLPAGATLTVTATHLITDLSGNALADTTSQFTTTAAGSASAPTVISMRPGNGATVVPTSTVITLFTSTPMNTGSLAGALHVSQNGVVISGATTVGSNGQSIEFTPGSALSAGVTIQVFLDSTAQDIYGNYLSYFSGQFTTAGSPTNTAATVQAVNPSSSATNVPLNTVVQVEYNQALLSSTINNTNVTMYQYATSSYLTPTLSLVGTQVINIAPTSNLLSGSQYQVCVTSAVTNTNGLAVQSYCLYFTAGTATDTVAPTILTIAPPDTSTNIGTNAGVSVDFNKAINPVSVTGSTIKLSGGSVTEVPSSISFTTDYKRTMITPQAPLPSSTSMAIAISGVTSEAGVAVTSQTTHFTTLSGADFSAPYVVHASVDSNQIVGTNAAFAMQFNKPMDPGSVNPAGAQDVYLYDYTLGYVATTISFSTDLTTVMLKPTANLTASHQFQLCSYYMTDLSGNPQQNFCVNFYTGTGTDTTGPVVQQVSPPSGFTGVGINAFVQILFNEPISGASVGGVTLKQSSSVIPTTATLYDGDQGIQLRPLVPLAPSMVYTINVTGVKDITGNTQSSFASQSFTTGTGTDLTTGTVVSTIPTYGQTGVAVTITLQAVFSKAMDPASFDVNNSFTLRDVSNNVVPATLAFSADFKTVTLQPKSSLTGGGAQYYFEIGYQAYLYDIAGNTLSYGYIPFTTK
ncbi:MAG: Ig-like domain-containing protein [Terriglobales bacterium]